MEEQDLKCPSGLPLAFSSHAELLTCMHGSIQLGTTCGRQAVASQLFQHSTTWLDPWPGRPAVMMCCLSYETGLHSICLHSPVFAKSFREFKELMISQPILKWWVRQTFLTPILSIRRQAWRFSARDANKIWNFNLNPSPSTWPTKTTLFFIAHDSWVASKFLHHCLFVQPLKQITNNEFLLYSSKFESD